MVWLTPPRVTGVIIATAYFILLTIPKPAAGAVLSKDVKVQRVEAGSLVHRDKKCVLGVGILGLCLDDAFDFLTHKEMGLLKLIWGLAKELGLPVIKIYQGDVCYTRGCLEAAYTILQAMDTSKDACKDFYSFACGRWIEKHSIPPTQARWNRINVAREKVNNFTQDLLAEEEDDTDARPINQAKQFYQACIDKPVTEAEGLQPLLNIIAEFGGWEMLDPEKWDKEFDWVNAVADVRRLTPEDVVISAYVSPDAKDTSRTVIYVTSPGFGVPGSILSSPKDIPEVMEAYKRYIKAVVEKLGTVLSEGELDARIQAIIDLEVTLAGGKTKGDQEDLYNPYPLTDLQKFTDDIEPDLISWKSYFDVLFSSSRVIITENEDIVVRDIEYLRRVIPILKATDLSTLSNYILWRLVLALLPDTTEAMRDIAFNFDKVQTGATERKSIEVTCADAALSAFGMAISVKYVDFTGFDEGAKNEVNMMTDNLIDSFEEMIEGEEWMDSDTKKRALAKAGAIHPFMAYPERLKDKDFVEEYYQGLDLPGSHFQNRLKINLYELDKELRTLEAPTDKNKWIADPTTVNAFYYRSANSITILLAMLQVPLFGENRPKSQNYGLMGSIIGHEIGHAFDKSGSQYNKYGNLEIWWDEKTLEEFERRTKCMIEQYSAYFVEQANTYINGELTLSENIADNGGILASFLAYQEYIPEKKLPGLEDFSSNQLFFIGYANMWCERVTDAGLKYQILTDPHSPMEFRVKGVLSNSMEFAEAFKCPVDKDGMNPPDKCRVW